MLRASLLIVLFVCGGFCDDCLRYTFEEGFEELWNNFERNCVGMNLWRLQEYSSLGIESPHNRSERFISPYTEPSCVSSFRFPMSAGGKFEVNVFMDSYSELDEIGVLVSQVVNEDIDTVVGLSSLYPSQAAYVQGWHKIEFELFGSGSYEGYVTFMGMKGSGSTVLIDSFRYIPRHVEDESCIIYEEITYPATTITEEPISTTIVPEEPTVVTEEPTVVTEEPTTVTEEQTTVTEEQTKVTEEPTMVTEEPTKFTEESIITTIITVEPTIVTEEPTTVTEEPTTVTEEPTTTTTVTEEPTTVTEKPTTTKTVTEETTTVSEEPTTIITVSEEPTYATTVTEKPIGSTVPSSESTTELTSPTPTIPVSEPSTTEAGIQFQENGCPVDHHIHWLLPHESDCNLFYYCVWGEKALRYCPSTLHFNPILQVCDWPLMAGCTSN